MKLTVEQRTKLFNLIRERVFKNKDNIKVVSSDHPNKSFIYEDDDFIIVLYYNQFGFGVATNDMLLISLHDKKSNSFVKFDSGDYIMMKNAKDFYNLVNEINDIIFDKDNTDKTTPEIINQILKNF